MSAGANQRKFVGRIQGSGRWPGYPKPLLANGVRMFALGHGRVRGARPGPPPLRCPPEVQTAPVRADPFR